MSTEPDFSDKRGTITDLLVTPDYSITRITFKKGAIRGNHYHEKTVQHDLVLKGKLLCADKIGKVKNETILKKGDYSRHEFGEAHAYEALENSELLSICFGVRKGMNYEKDVVRLTEKLL